MVFDRAANLIEGGVANEVLAAERRRAVVELEHAAKERGPVRQQALDLARDDHPPHGGADDRFAREAGRAPGRDIERPGDAPATSRDGRG